MDGGLDARASISTPFVNSGSDAASIAASKSEVRVTWDDVQPIFARSCASCHVGTGTDPKSGSGAHALASADKATGYKASQGASNYCQGKKVGECAIVRIKDGTMPQSGDCATMPKGPKCPSQVEQNTIQRWIDDGLLEK